MMQNPVFTVDGHTYEKVAIERWFASGHDTSPKTGALLSSTTIVPAHALRNAIEEWEEQRCRLISRADLTPVASTAPHDPRSGFDRATQIGVGSFKEVHRGLLSVPGAPRNIAVAVRVTYTAFLSGVVFGCVE
jgi:hypothetical protein